MVVGQSTKLVFTEDFVHNPSVLQSLYVGVFLLALATGNRVSELHSILRGEEFMEFSNLGVRLFPNPNFLAKNEKPDVRRKPIFISRLKAMGGLLTPCVQWGVWKGIWHCLVILVHLSYLYILSPFRNYHYINSVFICVNL